MENELRRGGKLRAMRGRQADMERAVDQEIDHHIAEVSDRLESEGWEAPAAQREARRRFGDVARIRREMLRAARRRKLRVMLRTTLPSLMDDVRHTVRGLGRSPAFTLTVILTLALGAGAAVCVFAVMDALLLRPLPYRQPDRLVTVNRALEGGGSMPYVEAGILRRWEQVADPLDAMATYVFGELTRTGGDEPESLNVMFVSANLDDVLGIRARLGRTFVAEDAVPGSRRVMLGFGYWQALGADPSLVGSTLRLGGELWDVVGVLPAEFKFPVAGRLPKLWATMTTDGRAAGREQPAVNVVARLRAGVTVESAQARMDAMAETLQQEAPRDGMGWKMVLDPVGRWRGNPDLVRGVWMLGGAVLLMLLIALANAVNLLLFRSTDRARELAVRHALGGGTRRLLRHLLSEGLLLGLASGALAVLVAAGGMRGLTMLMPEDLAFSSVYSVRVEARVLIFAFVISTLCGLVLGGLPARMVLREAARFDLLKGRTVSGRRSRLHDVLAAVEVMLATALLTGAGLLANSLIRLSRVDTGFDSDRVAIVGLSLPQTRYPSPAARDALLSALRERLRTFPGIEAAVADGVPTSAGFSFGVELQAEGREPYRPDVEYLLLPMVSADPDYLEVLGGRLVAGRRLGEADRGTRNVLVDEPLARALFGAAGPSVGARFRTDPDRDWYTVVGVVRHITLMGLDDRTSPFGLILPRDPARTSAYMSLAIRSDDPVAALSAARSVVHELDTELPIAKLETAETALAGTIEKPRFLATVMIGLAATALLLAVLGVYGVLSYAVTRRRRELGVRLAIGASVRSVTTIFVRRGLLLTGVGLVAGTTLGRVLAGLSQSLLYGVGPGDLLTTAAVATLIIATAAIGCMLPARRATRVDPLEVLRAE